MPFDLKNTAVMALALVMLSACGGTAIITVPTEFPAVVSQPIEMHVALVYTDEFRTYSATPNENTVINLGPAQVELLSKAFQGLFQQVDVKSPSDPLSAGTELVITPSVREVQVSSPDESYLNVYEVWIKYSLDISTPDGVPIDSWFLPAYGKTPDSMMTSRTEAIEEASIVALRDAGAKLMLDFFRIPAVYGWMQQNQEESQG